MLPFKTSRLPRTSGFGVVELIVVVAILAVILGVGTVAYSNILRSNLRRSTNADFATLEQRIQAARARQSNVLGNITGSWNTSNSCINRNVQTYNPCVVASNTAWNNIGGGDPVRDPWGSLYILNENEKEPASAQPCISDRIWSAGLNRIFENGTNDDTAYDVQSFFSGCQ